MLSRHDRDLRRSSQFLVWTFSRRLARSISNDDARRSGERKLITKVLVRQTITRWGVPDIMTPGRESQFVSDLWLEVCRWMAIARDPKTIYHPQHNGNVERMHRCLKNSLRASLLGRADWLELSWVMLGLHAAANIDTGVTPSMMVTGQQAALSGQLIVQ